MLLWAAQTTAVETSLTHHQIHHLQDLDPPSAAVWQRSLGVDQTGGEPTARLREEVAPYDKWPKNRKLSVPEEIQFRAPERV